MINNIWKCKHMIIETSIALQYTSHVLYSINKSCTVQMTYLSFKQLLEISASKYDNIMSYELIISWIIICVMNLWCAITEYTNIMPSLGAIIKISSYLCSINYDEHHVLPATQCVYYYSCTIDLSSFEFLYVSFILRYLMQKKTQLDVHNKFSLPN